MTVVRTSRSGDHSKGMSCRRGVFGEWELSDDEDMRMVREVLMGQTVDQASSVAGVAMECHCVSF